MTISNSSDSDQFQLLDSNFATTKRLTKKLPLLQRQSGAKFQSQLLLPDNSQSNGSGGLRTQGYFKHFAQKTSQSAPLVTVITIVYNGAEFLEKTIESVINQTYSNLEYIVIDGGSTDKSIEIIRRYENQIDYWISEPDKGIADAMNKGIILAQGNLIHHLHAGDLFEAETTIDSVVRSYQESPWRWCYGNQKKINPEGKVTSYLYPAPFNQTILQLGNTIPHSTVFIERSLLLEVGYFDPRFKCAMDYHLWLRLSKVAHPQKIDLILAKFLDGGVSADMIFALTDEIRVRRDVLNQTFLQKMLDVVVVALRYCKWKLNINTFARKAPKN